MQIYSIKFKVKGSTKYKTVLFPVFSFDQYGEEALTFLSNSKSRYGLDIDVQTILWCGDVTPLCNLGDPVLLLDVDLDAPQVYLDSLYS